MTRLREAKGLACLAAGHGRKLSKPFTSCLQELSAGEIPFEVVPAVRALELWIPRSSKFSDCKTSIPSIPSIPATR